MYTDGRSRSVSNTEDSSLRLFEENVTQCTNSQSDSVSDGSIQEKVTRNDLSTVT